MPTGRLAPKPVPRAPGPLPAKPRPMTSTHHASVAAAAAAKMPADPASLLARVSEAVAQHGGGAEQSDDLTLLALRWLGS